MPLKTVNLKDKNKFKLLLIWLNNFDWILTKSMFKIPFRCCMCFPTDKSETNVIFIEGKMEKKNIKKFHCFQWEQNVYIVFLQL